MHIAGYINWYMVKYPVINKHCSVFIWSQSIENKSNTKAVLQLVK